MKLLLSLHNIAAQLCVFIRRYIFHKPLLCQIWIYTNVNTNSSYNLFYFSPFLPARVFSFLSASTTTQSFSIEIVLATEARLAPEPKMITRGVRQAKRIRWRHTSHSRANISAMTIEQRATRLFWISRLIHTTVHVCIQVCAMDESTVMSWIIYFLAGGRGIII